MNTDVVVGVDGSANSVAALRWAATYAKLTGATVHAITTWEFPAYPDTSGMMTMPGQDFLIDGAQAILDLAINQAQLPRDVKVVGEVIEGPPAHTLIERSADAATGTRCALGAGVLGLGRQRLGMAQGVLGIALSEVRPMPPRSGRKRFAGTGLAVAVDIVRRRPSWAMQQSFSGSWGHPSSWP